MGKAVLILAIVALGCGVGGLVLGIMAYQKSAQLDEIAVMKDSNSTISESVARLQEEISGLSKKYATTTNLKEVATQTQDGFNAFSEQLTKLRTQSRADTIKIAEIEKKLGSGAPARSASPTSSSSTTSTSSTTSPAGTDTSSIPSVDQSVSTVPTGGTEYIIQSGDTLGKVAKDFGMTLDKLLSANPGVQPRYLRVGQKIIIPE